jgi:hypothetical protein
MFVQFKIYGLPHTIYDLVFGLDGIGAHGQTSQIVLWFAEMPYPLPDV